MAIEPTRYSRVSTGYVNSKQSIVDKYPGDTGRDFSCINGAAQGTWAQIGAATFSSTVSAAGAATFQSTVSARGQVNADAGVQVGGGTVAQVVSSVTTSVSFGVLGVSAGVSLVTVAFSGLSRNDAVFVTPDPTWHLTAAHRYIQYWASSTSTTGEANLWAVNSGLTAVTPTAGSIFRLTRIKFGNFPSA